MDMKLIALNVLVRDASVFLGVFFDCTKECTLCQ